MNRLGLGLCIKNITAFITQWVHKLTSLFFMIVFVFESRLYDALNFFHYVALVMNKKMSMENR